MRAARQSLVRSLDDVEAFLDDWNPPSPWKAVVKPLDSAGSDDVFLVDSRQQARECFDIIDGKVNDRIGDDKGMPPGRRWDPLYPACSLPRLNFLWIVEMRY